MKLAEQWHLKDKKEKGKRECDDQNATTGNTSKTLYENNVNTPVKETKETHQEQNNQAHVNQRAEMITDIRREGGIKQKQRNTDKNKQEITTTIIGTQEGK